MKKLTSLLIPLSLLYPLNSLAGFPFKLEDLEKLKKQVEEVQKKAEEIQRNLPVKREKGVITITDTSKPWL